MAYRLVLRHAVFALYAAPDVTGSPPVSQSQPDSTSSGADSVGNHIIPRGCILVSRPNDEESSQWPTEQPGMWLFEVAADVREDAADVNGYWLRRKLDGHYCRSHRASKWVPLPMAMLDAAGRHREIFRAGADFIRVNKRGLPVYKLVNTVHIMYTSTPV